LYRRALRLLAPASLPETAERQVVRDALRAELARHGLLGFVRTRPREAKLLVAAAAALLVVLGAMRFFEPDRAEGKPWVASSAWGSFPRTGIMRGEAPIDGRFHTVEEQDPWVKIDLQAVYSVHAVRIENRTNCCRERALPLAIELSLDGQSWKLVGYRRILFDTFTQHVPARDARYVRLRVDRRSGLHLRRVSVY
jgi:hypothetical protein